MVSQETWKDIEGFEGMYQISDYGHIRSLDRIYYQKSSHGTMMEKIYHGHDMNPTDNGNGYRIVSLKKPGIRKSCYIHRLVAQAFIPNPYSYEEINHKDYNKSNNAVSNLEWVDRLTNVHYSQKRMEKPRKKYKQTMTGEKYITIRDGRWRFSIRTKMIKFDRSFSTLEEAKAMREVIIGDEKHHAG